MDWADSGGLFRLKKKRDEFLKISIDNYLCKSVKPVLSVFK